MRNKLPYVFVTFRKHKTSNLIYAVFNQTFDPSNELIQVFFNDHHELFSATFILNETTKASFNDCNNLIQQLKSIYEVYVDGLAGIIKPVPYLPFK